MLSYAMQARLGASPFSVGLTRGIPASGMTPLVYDLQDGFHFLTYSITCTFPTVQGNPTPVDDGVNRLSVQFQDKNHQLRLSGETPLDLATIAAPGRQRYPGAVGDPSNALHIPGWPHQHCYAAKGGIIVNVFNAGNRDLERGAVNFTYNGFLIPTSVARSEIDVWRILLSGNPALNNILAAPGLQAS